MPRYFKISVLLLALLTASAYAAEKSPGDIEPVYGGGLMCFTVAPAPSGPGASCNALCEAKGAVCTGVTSNMSPPPSCESGARKD